MKYEVGQRLWFETTRSYGRSREVIVTKVGRKWISFEGDRFDKETGRVDGGGYSPPGLIFESQAAAEEEAARHRLWCEVRHKMSYAPAPTTSAKDIRRAAVLLGLEIEIPEKQEN